MEMKGLDSNIICNPINDVTKPHKEVKFAYKIHNFLS